MSFWTLSHISAALGPLLVGSRPEGNAPLGEVVTDSRALTAGDVFVALRGEKFDGHDFIPQAAERGVSAVIASSPCALGGSSVPVFVVEDTVAALGRLGRYRRRAWAMGQGGCVIAVAGSNGKTTTKEFIAAALRGGADARGFVVHATRGNLNNHIGVPLTLLSIPDSAQVAVVEVGTNHPGEVAMLRDLVEPDIAVITSIGEEHLEGLGSLEGVLQEECSICDRVPLAIVPANHPDVVAEARRRAARSLSAGVSAADVTPHAWGQDASGRPWLEVADADGVDRAMLPVVGSHNVSNAMLALAVAQALGMPLRAALQGLASATIPGMRSSLIALGAMTVYHDAYNANPASAREALRTFTQMNVGARQRVIVLGSMLELGAQSGRYHDEIAALALASDAQIIVGVGEFCRAFQHLSTDDARVVLGADVDDVALRLAPRLKTDALVLLKGSRGTRLERLMPVLSSVAGVASAAAVT